MDFLNGKYFSKRSYTFSSFISDISAVVKNLRSIRDTRTSRRISGKFAEHTMLANTSVNGCVYCEWGHTRMALEEGCSEEEIKEVLSLNFANIPSSEIIGLTFAQHYAESHGRPSKASLVRLVKTYGQAKSQDILNYCQMITLGNLLGNTVSAFISRIRGIPPKYGSIIFELLVFIFGGFFMEILSPPKTHKHFQTIDNISC